jgi:hypothetical protein
MNNSKLNRRALSAKTKLMYTLLAYLGFLITWGVGQVTAELTGEVARFFSLVFFMVVHIAIFGIAIPLYLSRRFGYKHHSPVSRTKTITGMAALLIVFIAGVFFSDALPKLQANPPSVEGVIKYLLLFLPMALGICLQSFFLIPRTIESLVGNKPLTLWLAVIGSSVSIGLGFWVDQLFSSGETAIVMMVLGIFFGLGASLTHSLPLTYLFFLPTMLVNTLSEGKYYGFPWSALILGFICSCVVLLHHISQLRSSSVGDSTNAST